MRFAVESQFGITADSLPCVDPWGVITFQVLRPNSRKARERAIARLKNDPVAVAAIGAQLRRATAKPAKPAPKLVNGSGTAASPEVLPPATEGEQQQESVVEKTPSDRDREVFMEAIDQAIAEGRVNPIDLFAKDRDLEAAIDLVGGWDAKDPEGKPIDCTPENVASLLTSDAEVQEGKAFAGETIGAVLVRHLCTFAKQHEEARQKYLEAAAKNSEGSSAGA